MDFINIPSSEKKPSKLLIARDRIHVEVGIFDGQQLFSWPGKSRFQFDDLHEMTESGASGSGEFGSFAISFLADSNRSSFHFGGIENWNGNPVARYDYEVPVQRSHYLINTDPGQRVPVAYNGSIFVDTESGKLRRLLINVPNPPRNSGLLKAQVDTAYEIGSQGSSDMPLIPCESTLAMVRDNRTEAVNVTDYKSCRIFSSESGVSFDKAAPELN